MPKKAAKVKAKKIDKILNLIIIVLSLLSLILAIKLYWPANFKLKLPSLNLPQVSQAPTAGRIFPADFTDDEKLALVPQNQDAPSADAERWFTTVLKIGAKADKLTLLSQNGDCFGRPTVFKVVPGTPFLVYNPGSTEVTLGMGEQTFKVAAGQTVSINPVFEAPEGGGSFSYGYGCGQQEAPSGLFLVE